MGRTHTGVVDGAASGPPDADLSPTACARRLLEALRAGEAPDPYLSTLAGYDRGRLRAVRTERTAGLAFWLNLYNAGTQLLLERRPDLYDSRLRFFRFFGAEALVVAGRGLSLDAIEQGILRGGRSKYGLGYLPRLPRRFERRYRLACDPRIHFACNCGAASCPAIRSYERDRIDEQLDAASGAYLDGTVEYDAERGVARLPRVFLWYRGDFGGKRGIEAFLRRYGAIPEDADPRFRYDPWDWSKADGTFLE